VTTVTVAEGQPADAAHPQPDANAAVRQRQHLRVCLSPLCGTTGHKQAIGAIGHRQCRLIWMILHQGVRYEERGPAVIEQSQRSDGEMIRQLAVSAIRSMHRKPQPAEHKCGMIFDPGMHTRRGREPLTEPELDFESVSIEHEDLEWGKVRSVESRKMYRDAGVPSDRSSSLGGMGMAYDDEAHDTCRRAPHQNPGNGSAG